MAASNEVLLSIGTLGHAAGPALLHEPTPPRQGSADGCTINITESGKRNSYNIKKEMVLISNFIMKI